MSVLYKHDNFVNKNNQLNYFDSEVAVVVVVPAILNSSGELQVIIFIYKYNFFPTTKHEIIQITKSQFTMKSWPA